MVEIPKRRDMMEAWGMQGTDSTSTETARGEKGKEEGLAKEPSDSRRTIGSRPPKSISCVRFSN